ncbi:glycosyltransferase family A protein [Pseudomonadota bacterium]
MLNFVIPLRSAKTTTDWAAVQKLLEQTLRSVDNQLCRCFRSLVVCHEQPNGIEIPDSCEIVQAPFDPPKVNLDEMGSEEALFEMHSDKGRKLIYGLSRVRQDPGAFVMFLDADDLVSNRLSELVERNPDCNGWYFNLGYRWNHQTPKLLFPRKKFFHECGSSYILNAMLAPFPETLDLRKDLDDYFVRRYVVHAYVRENMEKLGFPLRPLPFHGSIYTFNEHNFFATSFRGKDSKYRKILRIIAKGKKITPQLCSEFCIP